MGLESIALGHDVTVEWPTDGYQEQDSVTLVVGVFMNKGEPPTMTPFAGGICTVHAQDGRLTIEASALANALEGQTQAFWQLSSFAPRILEIPGIDHAALGYFTSRASVVPVE